MAEFDDKLGQDIRNAYDQVRLPEAAKEDMLQKLLAASVEHNAAEPFPGQGADLHAPIASGNDDRLGAADRFGQQTQLGPTGAGEEHSSYSVQQVGLHAAPKRRPNVLRFALPAAACLLVALVAGVIAFQAPMEKNDAAETAVMESTVEESADEASEYDAAPALTYEESDGKMDTSASEDWTESYSDEPNADAEAAESEAPAAEAAPESGGEAGDSSEALSRQDQDLKDAKVLLDTGEELHLSTDSAGRLQRVDASSLTFRMEDATLVWDDGRDPVTCEVYFTSEGSYAVLPATSETFYLAEAAS